MPICKQCGKEFSNIRQTTSALGKVFFWVANHQKYCSPKCSTEANRTLNREMARDKTHVRTPRKTATVFIQCTCPLCGRAHRMAAPTDKHRYCRQCGQNVTKNWTYIDEYAEQYAVGYL